MNKVTKSKVEISIAQSIKNCIQKLEGNYKQCSPGEQILLKPNFNTADPYPASSDIQFLEAVIEMLIEKGCDNLILGESSTLALKTKNVLKKLKVYKLEEKYKGILQIINFDEGAWIPKDIPNAKYLKRVSLPEILLSSDKLILLPCLKTHKLAQFTGAIKLSVGFMRPQERIALHARNLQEKISELNTIIPEPSLIIMDARKIFINNGPSFGELAEPNIILASQSRVAIDTQGIKIIRTYRNNSLIDTPPEELTQLKYANELGVK